MSEKLLTRMLNLKTNKQTNKFRQAKFCLGLCHVLFWFFFVVVFSQEFSPGPEVIKTFFMLSLTETKIYLAHKC